MMEQAPNNFYLEVTIVKYHWTKQARKVKLKSFERPYFDNRYYNNFKMSRIPIWISSFGYWLQKENNHNLPKYYRVFQRGTIVMVNFGVQLGAEFSGNHFAVVLNKKDNKYNPVLTVVPLSSKEKRWYANLGYEVLKDIQSLFERRTNESKELLKRLEASVNYLKKNIEGAEHRFSTEESQLLIKMKFTNKMGPQDFVFNVGEPNSWIDKQLSILGKIDNISQFPNINHYYRNLVSLNSENQEMIQQFKNAKLFISAMQSLSGKAQRFNKPTFANIRNITTISKLKVVKFSTLNISENIFISSEGMHNIENKINETI